MVNVKIPDPKKQYEKTPVYVDKAVTVKDKNGKDIATTQKIMLTQGTGQAATVVKYSDLDKLITDSKKASKTELLTGVSVASVEAAFNKAHPETHGRWGLGCPHNCGRFWEFKPNDKLDGWIPEDPVAIKGEAMPVLHKDKGYVSPVTGEPVEDPTEPVPTNGYLDWRQEKDGSVTFTCDRCQSPVKLEK